MRDVASTLSVKMPSVIKAVLELKNLGYVEQERYGDIRLTPAGEEAAAAILGRHRLLTCFLEKLGVSKENAEKDACLMEHILGAETLERIREFVGSGVPQPPAKRRARKATAPAGEAAGQKGKEADK